MIHRQTIYDYQYHDSDYSHHFVRWDPKRDLEYICHWKMRIHERSQKIRNLIKIIWDDTSDKIMNLCHVKRHQMEEYFPISESTFYKGVLVVKRLA